MTTVMLLMTWWGHQCQL